MAEAAQDEHLLLEERAETARWTGTGAGEPDAIPSSAFGPRRHKGRAPVRDFRQPTDRRFGSSPAGVQMHLCNERCMCWGEGAPGHGLALVRSVLTVKGKRCAP